jgi:hypothetical protein
MVEIVGASGLLAGVEWVMLVFTLLMLSFCLPATWMARRKAVLQGGPLLLAALRPRARRWWIVFLTLFSLMVVFNWLSHWLGVSPHDGVFLANQTLILLGSIAVSQMGLNGWYVELREAGVVDLAMFSSWADIREYRWVAQPAELMIWYRRRGVVQYRVAPEQRDAVDELLRQKILGPRS